jgi:deoxyribodipyrimidine photo-lyase
MQQSQRAEYNHALEFAVQQANRWGQGLRVVFGLMDDYPEANLRHYTFMLEGLVETEAALKKRGIQLIVRRGAPPQAVREPGRRASLIVCDRGYLRHQREWRAEVARHARCRVIQVESDVIVPINVVSNKAEYAARTIRPKIHRFLGRYLKPLTATQLKHPSIDGDEKGLDIKDIDGLLKKLTVDRRVPPVSSFFKGGTKQAKKIFASFLQQRFDRYAENRNQPQTDDVSHMSKYLHFGQISPLYLALKAKEFQGSTESRDAFMEELVVRRELAINFVHYTRQYDEYGCLPAWARKTLADHQTDRREYTYSQAQLEKARTHDEYWNAAMREMKTTGFMHNYMRMYWGKKILQWCPTPQKAFKTTLAINNKYFLDGRDPNSFTGVAWIFGIHDRGWKERPIFGKVRYMAASGLERKCDIEGYVRKVEALENAAAENPAHG